MRKERKGIALSNVGEDESERSRLFRILGGRSEWETDITEILGISDEAVRVATEEGALEELANAVLAEAMMMINAENAARHGLEEKKGKEMALKAAMKVKSGDESGLGPIQINLGGFDVNKVV